LSRALENLAQLITKSGTRISFSGLPVVQGSELLLAQVFQNLVSNAIKFRRSEPPQIHVSAEEGQDEWIFCVRDNGIGFKMEYAEKIFQVFKRLHHSDEYPGTGIGLGICKRIVERHGGRIWAVSEEGKGASFFFALPRGPRPRLLPPHPQLSSAYEGHDAVGFPS
jgi:chemotaxis family two-component system sensor kinase Cph1